MSLSKRALLARMAAGVALLAALLAISPGIGSQRGLVAWSDAWRARLGLPIDAARLLAKPGVDHNGDGSVDAEEREAYARTAVSIGFDFRLARSLLALTVGATLAICGASFQVLFRNPLATPYTLGVAGGAALGAMIAIRLALHEHMMGVSLITLPAFAGGLAVVGIVHLFARGSRRWTSNEMLLSGVTLGMFCSAMILLLQFLSNERMAFEMIRWMMGSLDTVTHARGVSLLPFIVPAAGLLILLSPAMNQYRMGDELAVSRGVNVRRLQRLIVLACTLATAAVVAQCGPIGFVGLIVPHLAALVVGRDCRVLLPASLLTGAAFLIVCDWLGQSAMGWVGLLTGRQLAGSILPIGVVTAVVGVPMFLILLTRRPTGL